MGDTEALFSMAGGACGGNGAVSTEKADELHQPGKRSPCRTTRLRKASYVAPPLVLPETKVVFAGTGLSTKSS